MNYYYANENNQPVGPCTAEQLRQLHQQGTLQDDSWVLVEGAPEWEPYASLAQLRPIPAGGSAKKTRHDKGPASSTAPQGFQSSNPPSIGRAQLAGTCPLCGNGKHMGKTKLLYDARVCRKCHNSFAQRRQFAYVFDGILGSFALIPVAALIYFLLLLIAEAMSHNERETGSEQFARVAFMLPLISGLIHGLIFACKDCFWGYSPGKWLCGVRVTDETTGKPGGIVASFKRNAPLTIIPVMPLIALIPVMPFIEQGGAAVLVGAQVISAIFIVVMALIVSRQLYKGHRIGDGWSNTKVIWTKYATSPVFAAGRM